MIFGCNPHTGSHGAVWSSGLTFRSLSSQKRRPFRWHVLQTRSNNMAPLAVTCPGMWGLPGWDTWNSKRLELIIYSSNGNCACKRDAQGTEMLFALRQMQLICIKRSGNRLPCFTSNTLRPGFTISSSQRCRWTSYQKKKRPTKPPKETEGRQSLWAWGLGTCLGGYVHTPGLLCQHTHIHSVECLFWTSCPEMEDTLFIK